MNYHIYQTDADYRFLGWDTAENKFDLKDYYKVYSSEVTNNNNEHDNEILNALFVMLNTNHPKNYHSRSLSVSDIVEIVRENVTRFYYCDIFGWKLILEVS